MPKCIKCESKLEYNENEQLYCCPNCGSKFRTATTAELKSLTDSSTETKTTITETIPSKEPVFSNVSSLFLMGMAITGILYIIFQACLLFGAISPIGSIFLEIFRWLSAIGFIICIISFIVCKKIEKYHIQTVVPMQEKMNELNKKIENLEKQIHDNK